MSKIYDALVRYADDLGTPMDSSPKGNFPVFQEPRRDTDHGDRTSRIYDAMVRSEREFGTLAPEARDPFPLANEDKFSKPASPEKKPDKPFYNNPFFRLALFASVAIISVASLAARWNSSSTAPTMMDSSTLFEGTMRPEAEVKTTALEPGIVRRITAHVGDSVGSGDLLMEIDSHDAQETLSQAQFAYRAAQEDLTGLRGELARAEADLSSASRLASSVPARQVRDSVQHTQAVYQLVLLDYKRTEALYENGIATKQALDNAATALRIAKDDQDNAQKETSATEDMQEVQHRQASLLTQISKREQADKLKEARLALQIASRRLNNANIRATASGVISAVLVRVGDQVAVGTPMAIISRTDRITVNVPVAVSMISSLQKTQKAKIKLPTMPPQEVFGTVMAISPIPGANMTHNVEVEFENPTGRLLVGQPAEVRFLFR